jgi:septum formation topological specificity factor MinE
MYFLAYVRKREAELKTRLLQLAYIALRKREHAREVNREKLKAEILEEIIKYLEGVKSLKGDAKVCSGDREFLWYNVF